MINEKGSRYFFQYLVSFVVFLFVFVNYWYFFIHTLSYIKTGLKKYFTNNYKL